MTEAGGCRRSVQHSHRPISGRCELCCGTSSQTYGRMHCMGQSKILVIACGRPCLSEQRRLALARRHNMPNSLMNVPARSVARMCLWRTCFRCPRTPGAPAPLCRALPRRRPRLAVSLSALSQCAERACLLLSFNIRPYDQACMPARPHPADRSDCALPCNSASHVAARVPAIGFAGALVCCGRWRH
jgi:hypothetical protein